jgi:hypothetical protein
MASNRPTQVGLETPVGTVGVAGTIDQQALDPDVKVCLFLDLTNDTLFLCLTVLATAPRNVPAFVFAPESLSHEQNVSTPNNGTLIAHDAFHSPILAFLS